MIREELIGKSVEVDGIKGIVIDETKNMIVIKCNDKARRFIKKNHKFTFKLSTGKCLINGDEIVMRPEERLRVR